ncbi:hypothetical protein HPB50_021011 [Hyalomma asiaticum]|uniref:Uncharacterized protein n=1 Tax=Hyalomma asiaticum TaxID=266040 RepID=A0ACB7SSI6_HYAAI|nr:hypothetical protein HPB50_021011 [Hyalomma asiaticum]
MANSASVGERERYRPMTGKLTKRKQMFNYFKDLGIPGPEPSIITGNMDELRKKLLFQCKRPRSPHNKSLIQLTGKRWKEVRSVLTPSFTTNKLKMMAPGMICTVREFVDKIAEYARSGEEFEIGNLYQAMTLDVICRSAMGIELAATNNGVHPFQEVQEKCGNIVRQRQIDHSAPQKDLLQLMIEAKSSNVDVASVTSDQLTAADDNEHELKQHAQHSPNGLSYSSKTVLDDDDITQNAFLVLVAGFVTREAVVDKQYGKLKIPAGTSVMAAIEYIHRDPSSWEKPDTFDPDRFLPERRKGQNPLAFQPFGAGPRNCIGMRFAQMELRFTLAHVLRKYRLVATPNSDKDPAEIDMNPLVLRIKRGVIVRAVPI